MTSENSPSKVDQPFSHLIPAEAGDRAESWALRCAVDDEVGAGQRLERRGDRPARIEIMRPGQTDA
jgi:hypothetical protein